MRMEHVTMDTTLTARPPSTPPPAPDVVVALSPDQLPAAQAHLVTWCNQQIGTLTAELQDLDEHRLLAVANGWKLRSIPAQIQRAKARRRYYEKVKAALEAGYLVVPNMPVDLLAVRVREGSAPAEGAFGSSTYRWNRFRTQPQVLPAGEGEYVDDEIGRTSETSRIPDGKGGEKVETTYYSAPSYDAPDFPIRFVKPVVLQATQQAMARRIFDEIGTVRQDARIAGKDPIMVGRIRSDNGRQPRIATFFLAWWLNPADL